LAANPFDCWLAERSLPTLPLRAAASCANAARLADFLTNHPAVSRVVYPGRADHPDHALAARLVPGFGNVVCFELTDRAAVNRFLRAAPGVPLSPSLGHVSTTVSYPDGTSHRFDSPADKRRQGITPGLVRLSAGCEPVAGTLAELGRGLDAARGG
jgi:cystathionine beta-lyase/cystathionine gamma-synthase